MRHIQYVFLTAIFTFGFILSPSAHAEEIDVDSLIIGCGVPQSVSVRTNPGIPVCDIYTRQLAYRVERLKLRDQLNERQKNFAAPSIEAYNRYVQMLVELNEERSEKENEDKKDKKDKSDDSMSSSDEPKTDQEVADAEMSDKKATE